MALLAASAVVHGASAETTKISRSMVTGEFVFAPRGYIEYCIRSPKDCERAESVTLQAVPLTPQFSSLLNDVNQAVNRAIGRKTDLVAYGTEESWRMPLRDGGGRGDCEDYVLEKRRALLEAGVPDEVMSIAVVTTLSGAAHAVLLVETSAGPLVMDNLTPWLLPWEQTGYRWEVRQARGAGTAWLRIRDGGSVPELFAPSPTAGR